MNKIIRKRNKLGQFTKASPWDNVAFIKKATSVLLMTLMLVLFLGIKETKSYYNDTETSSENSFSTGFLDFVLTNNNLNKVISSETLGEISHVSVTMPVDGSLPMQYDVSTSIDTDTSNSDFCNGFTVEAKLNGITKYNGSLPGLGSAITTTFGSWEFRFLPPTISIPNGVRCNASVIFSIWRADIVNKADSSWHDEETLDISFSTRTVVLNEFLPRPDGIKYGHDFGDDNSDIPKGEWVELYNNSNTAQDVSGWYIRDSLDTSDHKIMIDTTHTGLETQIISANGFLVVYMNKAMFNNTGGDSVRLFDNNDVLIDSYSYTLPADFCNLKPTEGSTNDEDGSGIGGGCTTDMPTNKSYARIPDGIGAWVDPIPTPGMSNELPILEELVIIEEESEVVETSISEVIESEDSLEIIEPTPVENTEVVIGEEPNKEEEVVQELVVIEEVAEVSLEIAETLVVEEAPVVELVVISE